MRCKIILLLLAMVVSAAPLFAADCEQALFGKNGIFEHEGGYQNFKTDTGNFRNGKNCGGTKYGITCRDHPGINIKLLTKESAAKIYRNDEWRAIRGDDIKSQELATRLMDLAVNMGSGSAIILLERTVNDLNGTAPDIPLVSHVQWSTIDWVNNYTKTEYLSAGEKDKTNRMLFYRTLILFAQMRYNAIAANPKQRQWLYTWSTRLLQH